MHMEYNCKIINIVDDEATVRIGDAYIEIKDIINALYQTL